MGHPAFFAGVANTMAHSLDSLPDRPVLTQGRLARTNPTVGILTQTLKPGPTQQRVFPKTVWHIPN
jgi:hypothetical protein